MRRNYFEAFRKIDRMSSENGVEVRWAGRTYYSANFEMDRMHKRYLLLYIFNGECLMHDESGNQCVLTQGHILLIPPGKQRYGSYHERPFQCYGISFSGHLIDNVIGGMPIMRKNVHYIGVHENLLDQFHDLINEMILRPPDQSYIIWGIFFRFLGEVNTMILQRDCAQNNEGIKTGRIARSAQFIRINYNRDLRVGEIAAAAGYSVSWFEKLFQDYCNMSPIQYQMTQRIDRAKDMIRTNVLNIAEIGQAVGFDDAFYFSRVFKKYTGICPSRYREICLQKQNGHQG